VLPLLMHPHLSVLFFNGKGKVGKTTGTTAAALYQARRYPRRTVLLVSTDPAHSLAASLGGEQCPENLKILEFDAHDFLETFKHAHRDKLVQIVARGLENLRELGQNLFRSRQMENHYVAVTDMPALSN
jgi:anion-transporting  ArsA/GET3 family ATPase